jgi:hypothetical protein
MKQKWFKEAGLFYIPISPMGWVVTILAAIFCLHIFLFVDSRSGSVSDTLYGIFPYVVPTALAWYIIASRTSKK